MKHRVVTDVDHYGDLGSLLDDVLVQHGSAIALIEAQRREEASRWTYRSVRRRARDLAARMAQAGVGADSRVAFVMSNQPAWLVSATAVFRRGAVLVPLDFKLQAEEQLALLDHCKPDLMLIDYGSWRAFDRRPDVPAVWVVGAPDDVSIGDAQRWEDTLQGDVPLVVRGRNDQATLVYSSGTGGRAKGCILSHGAYLCQLKGLLERFAMTDGDRMFSVLPTNHAIDFMVGFVGPFVCGATVVHQRTLRPEFLRWTMKRYGITHMAVVPLLLSAFERAIREQLDALPTWQRAAFDALVQVHGRLVEKRPQHALSSRVFSAIHQAFGGRLRLMFCGGAPTDRDMVSFFYDVGITVVVGYGLTEACTVVTVNGVEPFRPDSVGKPVRGVDVKIASPDAAGVGEVWVRGPTLMDGYLDDPELTAQTIKDGWLHTGDLGRMDAAGCLHLVGRSKDVIVTAGGKNVYPQDVEHVFSSVDVDELALFASHTLWPGTGLGDEYLVMVVRAASTKRSEILREMATLNRGLADYKRVRSIVWWEDEFPRTASMKVKRPNLVEALQMGDAEERQVALGDVA